MKKLFLIVLSCLSFNANSADYIGVTAAMSGEVKRTGSTTGAFIGALKSGSKIFEGDKINVSPKGRLQVMLRDQTTFTLGSGAEMVIDQYVSGSNGKISAGINRGAFRFVSGLIAKNSADALKVKLPHATIGVRGTQVAGEVDEDGASDVVLIGPGPNSFGATPGAITIENEFGSVDVIRAGYAVSIDPVQPPSEPVVAPPALIQRLERAVQELAGEEVAAAVIVENASPEVLALAEALVSSGVRGDDTTNDTSVLSVIADATGTGVAALEGINFTGEAAFLILTAFGGQDLSNAPAGPLLSELTGSYRYTANNVVMTGQNDSDGSSASGVGSGTFNSVTTWSFTGTPTVSIDVEGSVSDIDLGGGETTSFTFDIEATDTLDMRSGGDNEDSNGNFALLDYSGFDFVDGNPLSISDGTAGPDNTFDSTTASPSIILTRTDGLTTNLTNTVGISVFTGVISAQNTGDVGYTTVTTFGSGASTNVGGVGVAANNPE